MELLIAHFIKLNHNNLLYVYYIYSKMYVYIIFTSTFVHYIQFRVGDLLWIHKSYNIETSCQKATNAINSCNVITGYKSSESLAPVTRDPPHTRGSLISRSLIRQECHTPGRNNWSRTIHRNWFICRNNNGWINSICLLKEQRETFRSITLRVVG